ncbi:hypothetical protein V5E97_39385 [Singulisphaera sp. Ch08]|uniref:DUF4177 domain-containing protein n=1 Tax=Singulisphaera sp. Ch08 TaxID=3120278 RepID=A0AAU7CH27_9BACT
MDPSNDRILRRTERNRRLGRGSGTVILVLAGIIGCFGLFGTKVLEAQPRATRAPAAQPVRRPNDYRQVQVVWANMAETLNQWEEKGWETFQIVPIQATNPGVGAPMTVAILFRRPAK